MENPKIQATKNTAKQVETPNQTIDITKESTEQLALRLNQQWAVITNSQQEIARANQNLAVINSIIEKRQKEKEPTLKD